MNDENLKLIETHKALKDALAISEKTLERTKLTLWWLRWIVAMLVLHLVLNVLVLRRQPTRADLDWLKKHAVTTEEQ